MVHIVFVCMFMRPCRKTCHLTPTFLGSAGEIRGQLTLCKMVRWYLRMLLDPEVKVKGCCPLNYIICLEGGSESVLGSHWGFGGLLLFKVFKVIPLVGLWLHELITSQVSKYKSQHKRLVGLKGVTQDYICFYVLTAKDLHSVIPKP